MSKARWVVALMLATLTPLAAIAKPVAPDAWMPEDAVVVAAWKSPAKTLRSVERLASDAGLAPPGAKRGWLLKMVRSGAPWMTEVDLSKPAWMAMLPAGEPQKGAAPNKPPAFVVVLGLKGDGKAITSQVSGNVRTETKDGWLALATGEAQDELSPKEEHFVFPKHVQELRRRSDVAVFVDFVKLPLDQLPSAEDKARVARQMKAMEDFLGTLTFGVELGRAGVSLFSHQVPDLKSPLAKAVAALENSAEPLIRGLPRANYGLVVGAKSDPETASLLMNHYLSSTLPALEEESPELSFLVGELRSLSFSEDMYCQQSSFGAGMPGGPETFWLLGSSAGKKPKSADAGFRRLADVLNRVLQEAEKQEKEDLGIKVAEAGDPLKIEGATLGQLGLVEAKVGGGALDNAPAWAKTPLLHGPVGKDGHVMSWNAPPPVVSKLVQANRKRAPTPLRAFRKTQKALIRPRIGEGFLRIGTFAPAFLEEDMAPLGVMLRALPPLGFAVRTYADGSLLSQVFLPRAVAEVAAAFARMGSGGAPPKRREAPTGKDESERGI